MGGALPLRDRAYKVLVAVYTYALPQDLLGVVSQLLSGMLQHSVESAYQAEVRTMALTRFARPLTPCDFRPRTHGESAAPVPPFEISASSSALEESQMIPKANVPTM